MLYSINNIKYLESSNELVPLENQVKLVRLKDKLGKQNFHEDMKKVFEPVTKSIRDVSRDITKTMTENSIKNNKALEILNETLLEIMKDRVLLASYLLSPLSKITDLENNSRFILVENSNSNRVKDLLIHKTKPVTLYNKLLTFRDTDEEIELKDLLKMISNKKFNVDLVVYRIKN